MNPMGLYLILALSRTQISSSTVGLLMVQTCYAITLGTLSPRAVNLCPKLHEPLFWNRYSNSAGQES
jgi:hypothetical protein